MQQSRAYATRAEDERLLAMLDLRDRGVTHPEIGRRFGVPKNTVKSRVSAVYRDLTISEES